METKKMSLATVAGKLSRAEMKNIMAGAMACANCFLPGETVCVWYNPDNSQCTDSGYGDVFCVNKSTGEQTHHSCGLTNAPN
ncbi:MAG: hypothetical protein IT252_07695 [Chitinophagaceae bacterium]|jgi:hypothetical protein|nr:hypothetical protein [Chitinophagaceae bacterium]